MSQENSKRANENYELKSEAVEQLVQAQSGEAPEYSQEELDRYTTHKGIHIPMWLKVIGIKAWFAGAVCFFILWGLGNYITAKLDMLFSVAVVYGMVTDILVNNVIRFMEKTPGEHDKWLLFPKKGMVSFGLNLLFAFVIIFCVYITYDVANYAIMSLSGNWNTIPIGVEPILFGLLCMGYDMLLIGIKTMFLGLVRDAKAAAKR